MTEQHVRQICTKQKPMPRNSADRWFHKDAKETEYDGEYYIEYKCPHCELIFTTEMTN